MLAQVTSGAVRGVDAYLVRVEVDLASGLPGISVVGLPESAVREGRERVSAALANSGYPKPPMRITVNLAPADIRKEGSAFDLPIAVGLLAGTGVVPGERLGRVCMVGELGLDGELRPVRGVLPLALRCRESGLAEIIVPAANAREAGIVEGLDVRAAENLVEVIGHLRGESLLSPWRPDVRHVDSATAHGHGVDFADVRGQGHAKRALEVAAAGSHNLILIGPPGSGKSMLARRLGTILPPLTRTEAIEITKIHSVAGQLRAGRALVERRPFRAPHHTISDAGLIGGGAIPRPGEASLAHHGVLFLDELPEFRRSVLEVMRQPLEEGTVSIGRARYSVAYPARFMLAAAMNPCPCGFFGDGEARCTCHWGQVQRYRSRVSGPLLDRIDIHVEVPTLPAATLTGGRTGESSEAIRRRVVAARNRQSARFRECPGIFANSHMRTREVARFCGVDRTGERLLRAAIDRLRLSARAFHRVLKLSRTIADLEGADRIAPAHIAEAVQYRSLDRRQTPEERWAG